MTELDIRVDGDPGHEPGGDLEGTFSWSAPEPLDRVELRLFWWTSGKGSRDLEVVDRVTLELPEPHGERRFRFLLPPGPCSFSGGLITLSWGLEVVAEPPGDSVRHDLVVAPGGAELDIRVLREF